MSDKALSMSIEEIVQTIFAVLTFITIISAIVILEDNNLLEANLLAIEIQKSAEYMAQDSTITIELNEDTTINYNNNELNIQIGKSNVKKPLQTRIPITITQAGQTLTLKS